MNEWWLTNKVQKTYKEWQEIYHGCALCNCGHGCREWLADNAPKALYLFKAFESGASTEELDKLSQRSSDEFVSEMWLDFSGRRKVDNTKQV